MIEHEQVGAMDTKSREVKNTTNDFDNKKYEFEESQTSGDGMILAECKHVAEDKFRDDYTVTSAVTDVHLVSY